MPYFDKFPYTTFSDNGNKIFVRDIVNAIELKFNPRDYPNLFYDYYLQDGEKIENVAYKVYGSTGYHWVLIYINGIKDPINDLPQKDYVIREACIEIYGNPDATHHYENANNPGEWVDFLFTPAIIITNLEYMTQENEKKRQIKILHPQYLSEFVNLYMNEVTG